MVNKDDLTTPFSGLTNPSGKHKDWYRIDFLRILLKEINAKKNLFPVDKYIKLYQKKYESLELKERLVCIADLLDEALAIPYAQQLKAFEPLLGKEWPNEDGMFGYGFHLYPIAQFVEIHALKDIPKSLDFIEELTKRFTGEWAIRTIANADEKLTLKTMKAWAKDDNFHVRRLASEGLRAKLPWGKKIDWVNANPEKTLPIYNKLRNDKVLYVRRSVANSMGDMIKVDDELAYTTLQKWFDGKHSKDNLWVIQHAIRTPVKKGVGKYMELKEDVGKAMKKL
ncbi:MAG: hypothetical protein AAF518_11090 [Spirochaetota bacterium]